MNREIYDAGIKRLAAATSLDELPSDMDFSVYGYDYWSDQADCGEKHILTIEELIKINPQLIMAYLRSKLSHALRSGVFSTEELVQIAIDNDKYEPGLPELYRRCSVEQLKLLGAPALFYPDSERRYLKMTDEEIIRSVPGLDGLTGNRTANGCRFIRGFIDAPELSKFKVIMKKSRYTGKNQHCIGYTNGKGGYCKSACFLDWN